LGIPAPDAPPRATPFSPCRGALTIPIESPYYTQRPPHTSKENTRIDQIVTAVTDVANSLPTLDITLGVIGVGVSLVFAFVGYRHGSDVMRGRVIGMLVVLAITALGNRFKVHLAALAPHRRAPYRPQ